MDSSKNIVTELKQGGTYTYLRRHVRNHRRAVLFRFVQPEAGVNHHEFLLARRPNGSVRAVDVYTYLSGEALSESSRRLFIRAAAGASRSLLSRLIGSERDFVKALPKIQQMSADLAKKNFQAVLDTYSELPESMRKDKNILIIRMQAAQGVQNDNLYLATLQDFRNFHPQDPCVDMISINYFLFKNQFADALASTDRMEKALGGDPYMEIIRAGIHLAAKDRDTAYRDLKRAAEQEPGMLQAHEGLLSLSLELKKFDDTLAALTTLRDRFAVEIHDLRNVPEFVEFVKSPEFEKWEASNKDKEKEKTETKEAVPTPSEPKP